MSRRGKGRSATRVITYSFQATEGKSYPEAPLEAILTEARLQGYVTQFDTGRGHGVWFNGRPGKKLRALRDVVEAYVRGAK
jgi:hypothetical protein